MDEGLAGGLGASVDLALAAAATGGHAAHGHGPASTRCLNCGHLLGPQDHFCSACGQDTANHPPTLKEFAHEFVDHYVAAEGKLWKSLWGLLARPGFLTLEYLAGRKTRYVLPLRLLLTLGLLFFMALKLTGGDVESQFIKAGPARPHAAASATATPAAASAAAPAASAADVDRDFELEKWEVLPASTRARLKRANERWRADPDAASHALKTSMLAYAPYAVLCSLPFFAALLKLLFWRQTYGTHFVFAMHLHAAWYGMLLVTILLPWSVVGFAVWLWSNVYPVIALKRVHAAGWATTLLRAAMLALLHWILIAVGLLVLTVAGMLAVT